MAARVIQQFQGFSGSQIFLMQKHNQLFVRKISNIARNYNRITALTGICPVPKIYTCTVDTLDMEYIHGLDMRNWLLSNSPKGLIRFLQEQFSLLNNNTIDKDYSEVYQEFLSNYDQSLLPFDKNDLFDQLPKQLPSSVYIGDLTLENIIATDHGFYVIDCQDSVFDSFVFDIAKLRQDLHCRWFLRNRPAMIENKLGEIEAQIVSHWPQGGDNYLLILMLMRVLRYAPANSQDFNFLQTEIKRLWK
jgi:hypothetical protein